MFDGCIVNINVQNYLWDDIFKEAVEYKKINWHQAI